MTPSLAQLLRRQGAFVPGITGIALVVALITQEMVHTSTNFLYAGGQSMPNVFVLSFGYALLRSIPFGLGFFLSLWLIAPIAEELRVPDVIIRAILATGVATMVTFIVTAVLAIVGSFGPGGGLFGNSFPFPGFSGSSAVQGLLSALVGAINGFISNVPLGLLAGLVLWLWRKDHPPKRPPEGLMDL